MDRARAPAHEAEHPRGVSILRGHFSAFPSLPTKGLERFNSSGDDLPFGPRRFGRPSSIEICLRLVFLRSWDLALIFLVTPQPATGISKRRLRPACALNRARAYHHGETYIAPLNDFVSVSVRGCYYEIHLT